MTILDFTSEDAFVGGDARNPRVLVFSVPNERRAGILERKRLRLMGMLPGVADFVIVGKDNVPVWVEFKSPKGKQTEAQKEFQADVEARGMRYYLIRSKIKAAQMVQELESEELL